MSPNDADGIANSVYPDQTAPLEAVWSGSALFAQAYLSENLGSLRYSLTATRPFWKNQGSDLVCSRTKGSKCSYFWHLVWYQEQSPYWDIPTSEIFT